MGSLAEVVLRDEAQTPLTVTHTNPTSTYRYYIITVYNCILLVRFVFKICFMIHQNQIQNFFIVIYVHT